jgi:competence protein ComFA
MDDLQDYYGRLFTKYQLTEAQRQLARVLPFRDKRACPRCASPYEEENQLPNGSFYCRECILLGRVRSDQELYYFPQEDFPRQQSLNWQGQLTPFQAQISQALCQAVDEKRPSLVHAVTGAGKTEMIYAVVAKVLDRGGTVCIATPRIDVCIELHKRLVQDFNCPIALLHGESEAYFRTPLVIATTHQLLKFYRAFDLLIIDEVDAFPYADNPMLYQAVDQSTKEDGLQLFLTATSTDELDKKVKDGRLQPLKLPRRFHGNPLVVPQKVWLQGLEKKLKKDQLPRSLKSHITRQRQTGFPLLLFAPEIKIGQKLATVLEKLFPDENISFVSSQTENRLDIVEGFRNKDITILVSTTILERGVTFPCVDVMVVEANHRLYTSSSLIQIGGRVGRSMERPTGDLLFFMEGSNRAIEKAIAEIKTMNQEAGYD